MSSFTITAPTKEVKLDAAGKASVPFTVTNTTKKSVRGTPRVARGSSDEGWLKLQGNETRGFAPAAAQQFVVEVRVPPGTPVGKHSFGLNISNEANPEDDCAEGPLVVFDVTAAKVDIPQPPPKWGIWVLVGAIVLIGGLIVLIGGGIAVWLVASTDVRVPNVVGMTVVEATKTLGAQDLRVGSRRDDATGVGAVDTVLAQDPTSGTTVDSGTPVALTVKSAPLVPVMPRLVLKRFEAVAGPAAHPAVQVTVDANYKVISGGAVVTWSGAGSMLTESYPAADGRTWVTKAKDHSVSSLGVIRAFALGLHDPDNLWEVQISSQRSSAAVNHPEAIATLPAGFILTGGGARAEFGSAGSLLTASYPPDASSWKVTSKDHGAADPCFIVAFVVGIRPRNGAPTPSVDIAQQTSSLVNHPSASLAVPAGRLMLGGGAFVRWSGAGNLLTASYPTDDSTWLASAKDHVTPSPATITVYTISIPVP